jgi:hypothetical protein
MAGTLRHDIKKTVIARSEATRRSIQCLGEAQRQRQQINRASHGLLRQACAFLAMTVLISQVISALPAHAQDTAADFSKGSIQLGYDSQNCDASLEGTIRYNSGGPGDYLTSLANRWTLDETSGGTITDSVGGNNGTWTDGGNNSVAEETIAGQIGTALAFNTSRQIVSAGLTLPDEGTFSAWVTTNFPDEPGTCGYWASCSGSCSVFCLHEMILDTPSPRFSFKYNQQNKRYEFTTNGSTQTSYTPPADLPGWFHLALTWSTSGSQIYINASAAGSAGTGDDSSNSPTGFYLADRTNLDRGFDGDIDDVRIYSAVLTQGQIQQIYDAGIGGGGGGAIEFCGQACPLGALCDDGTYYVGLTPDGNVPAFMADSGSQVTRQWDDGTSEDDPADSWNDGDGNTAALVADGPSHPAAEYCDGLSAHGYSDWYLPSVGEIISIFDAGFASTPANQDMAGSNYWTSYEFSSTQAWYCNFQTDNNAQCTTANKTTNYNVRCFRQDAGAAIYDWKDF